MIEHIAVDPVIFDELRHVRRQRGLLILDTPHYATIGWLAIEPLYALVAPGGCGGEHITHHSRTRLEQIAAVRGLRIAKARCVCNSEPILAVRWLA